MTKAVILVSQQFQDEEFIYSYYRMLEEGWEVDVATPTTWRKAGKTITTDTVEGMSVYGKFGCPAHITKSTDDLRVEDYDLVVIPGGFVSPDMLRMRPEVVLFVRSMFNAGKLVAAQCHGPWVCISAGIVKHRVMTCYVSLKDDVINAGGLYSEKPVVVDQNLITAPHYKNNGDFMKAIVEYMKNG